MDGSAVDAIAELTDGLAITLDLVPPGEGPGVIALASHEGTKVETVDLEKYAEHPRRKKGTVVFRTADGFAEYVNRHKEPGTLILADGQEVIAYLNHHEPNVNVESEVTFAEGPAGWRDHVAKLELKYTPSWTAWTGFAGRFIEQEAFAYFLEERVRDVAQPSGAELLEVALNLRVHLEASFEKALVTQNGQVRLNYQETVTAASTKPGEMVVPEKLVLGLKPFEGGEPFAIPALLRYRLRQGKVEFLIQLGDEAQQVFEEAFDGMCARIGEQVGVPVLRGRLG